MMANHKKESDYTKRTIITTTIKPLAHQQTLRRITSYSTSFLNNTLRSFR